MIDTDPTIKQKVQFIIPSLIGAFLFLIPIRVDEQWTVLIGIIAENFLAWSNAFIVELLVGVLVFFPVLHRLSRQYLNRNL